MRMREKVRLLIRSRRSCRSRRRGAGAGQQVRGAQQVNSGTTRTGLQVDSVYRERAVANVSSELGAKMKHQVRC